MGGGLVRNGSHHREGGDVDCRARNGTIVKTSINSISRNLAQLRHVKKLDDAELRNTVVLEVSGT